MLYIDNNKINPFIRLCKDVALHGSTSITYQQRGNLLLDSGFFKKSPVESGTSMLDANIYIIALSNKLIYLAVYKHWNAPFVLDTKTVFHDATIILNELSNSSGHLKDINKYLNKYVTEKKKNGVQTAKK
jgi:hypothetical protein